MPSLGSNTFKAVKPGGRSIWISMRCDDGRVEDDGMIDGSLTHPSMTQTHKRTHTVTLSLTHTYTQKPLEMIDI